VPDGSGGWAVGETLTEARAAAGKVQGRRSTLAPRYPLSLPTGTDWALTLRTTWVEPAYLEPDASWCLPGGEPATPLANGGAFGGKLASIAPAAARELAARYRRPVRVLLAREDVVRLGPKRPPIAAGLRQDGSGVLRVVRTPGIAAAIASLPGAERLEVEEVDVGAGGLGTSAGLRAAGWGEAAVLLAGLRRAPTASVVSPEGAEASARVEADGSIDVSVSCGPALDPIVLRSYAIGAAHQALGWVTSEALAVDESGEPQDLTIRSFGIRRASEMPVVTVRLLEGEGPERPVNGSDAVFAAVAAAVWIDRGLGAEWPIQERISR
jgi:CO/xanthine dehydrogenase Mo-binding subunit